VPTIVRADEQEETLEEEKKADATLNQLGQAAPSISRQSSRQPAEPRDPSPREMGVTVYLFCV